MSLLAIDIGQLDLDTESLITLGSFAWLDDPPFTDVDGLTILGFLGEAAKLSEAERANREAEASERVSQFFVELFETADPWADVGDEPAGASPPTTQASQE